MGNFKVKVTVITKHEKEFEFEAVDEDAAEQMARDEAIACPIESHSGTFVSSIEVYTVTKT